MAGNLNAKTLAALVAVGGAAAGGGYYYNQPGAPPAGKIEKRVTYDPRPASERDWSALSKKEITELQARLRGLGGEKVEIFCGGNFCKELAEDLDEALEASGFDSNLPQPLFDLGKGIGMTPDNDKTRAIAKAVKDVTGGRIDIPTCPWPEQKDKDGKVIPPDKIALGIGRKPPGAGKPPGCN